MKAIVLVSGGLDSMLTVRAIKNNGVEPIALHFHMPFVKATEEQVKAKLQKNVVEQIGCKLRFETVSDKYMEMFKKPKHGYGKNLNPCIDCKILFLTLAKKIMEEEGASFLATGEVLGQRPMSQRKWALDKIEQQAGVEDLLVRPLCALSLPPTLPQKEGWIKKEFLHGISGRGRTPQMKLAKEWDIVEYPAPAGGCLLTDPGFSRRLQDLIDNDDLTLRNIEFLKTGRHVRVSGDFILSVGKDQTSNDKLEELAEENDFVFTSADLPGPYSCGAW